MTKLEITFENVGGKLTFRANPDVVGEDPVETAIAGVVVSFLKREINIFYAAAETARRLINHGTASASAPVSSPAEPTAPSAGSSFPAGSEAAPSSPYPPPDFFDQPGD